MPHPTQGAAAAQPPTCHIALPFLSEPKVPNLLLGVLRPVWVGVTLLHNVKEFPVAGDSGGLSGPLALAPGVLNPAVASGHGCWAIPDGTRFLLNGGSQVLQGARNQMSDCKPCGVPSSPNQLYRAGEHMHPNSASSAKGYNAMCTNHGVNAAKCHAEVSQESATALAARKQVCRRLVDNSPQWPSHTSPGTTLQSCSAEVLTTCQSAVLHNSQLSPAASPPSSAHLCPWHSLLDFHSRPRSRWLAVLHKDHYSSLTRRPLRISGPGTRCLPRASSHWSPRVRPSLYGLLSCSSVSDRSARPRFTSGPGARALPASWQARASLLLAKGLHEVHTNLCTHVYIGCLEMHTCHACMLVCCA